MSADILPLFIEQIEVGSMKNFTYVVGPRTTREVALADPDRDLEPTTALATHLPSGPLRMTATGTGCRTPERREPPERRRWRNRRPFGGQNRCQHRSSS